MIPQSSPEIEAFWKAACEAIDFIDPNARRHAMPLAGFDENTEQERLDYFDTLCEMAVHHQKRGSCHLLLDFEKNNVSRREVDDYWIITKCDGTPRCVVKMISVYSVPFNQIGPDHAAMEGPEEDLIPNYENFRHAHSWYFKEQCAGWGVEWREDLPVVAEHFVTVYSPDHPLGIRNEENETFLQR